MRYAGCLCSPPLTSTVTSLYGTLRSLAIKATRRVQVNFKDPWSVNAMGKRIRVRPQESAASVRCGCAMYDDADSPRTSMTPLYLVICAPEVSQGSTFTRGPPLINQGSTCSTGRTDHCVAKRVPIGHAVVKPRIARAVALWRRTRG